ncbi:hypothetical protein RJ640_000406 [Escallonia rubra]|uniref:Histone acetyltransferase n=1 Tax=Escallonia rubra TaxID=112253 RepID=A0AA88UKS8_9ASTE|nr:hypothetical protein RJ640_000406 [Escallonia rubra]
MGKQAALYVFQRVVNEIHSTATRKNKEWQDKLPAVVLRAEEIMYSKANSENEYVNLKTLRNRVNEAIDTIIRRDESAETGVFLQPCIEAALNLGCTPRRASRSQRYNTPSCYLRPSSPEPSNVPSCNVKNLSEGNNPANSQYISHYSNFMEPTAMNSTYCGLESLGPVVQNMRRAVNLSRLSSVSYPPSGSRCLGTIPSASSCSPCPLYYGDCVQSKESKIDIGTSSNEVSHRIEPDEMDVKKNVSSCSADALNSYTNIDCKKTPTDTPGNGCDLSLRLGPLKVQCVSIDNSWTQEVEDVGSSSLQDGSKLSQQMDKEFSFFPKPAADNPSDSSSSKWSYDAEKLDLEATLRKRKAVLSHQSEDRQFHWLQKFPYNQFSGTMRKAGP